ncbi:hypothetical protein Nepgr_026751 [Nepenthes gracilis]|uniref:Uncharacterized protein n=1 Tax=Nepenthes gracilis TaxID=150966 RepID=A0AAD3T8W2_NEPGR|nr:hypothetical protein Nepgr_026751 [Nepenthes gracilis]
MYLRHPPTADENPRPRLGTRSCYHLPPTADVGHSLALQTAKTDTVPATDPQSFAADGTGGNHLPRPVAISTATSIPLSVTTWL